MGSIFLLDSKKNPYLIRALAFPNHLFPLTSRSLAQRSGAGDYWIKFPP